MDKATLLIAYSLLTLGLLLTTTASPQVALRIGLNPSHFVHKQYLFAALGLLVTLMASTRSSRQIRSLAAVGFVISLALVAALPWVGHTVKGACRWISIAGVALQPSEFLKAFLVVLTASLLDIEERRRSWHYRTLAVALVVLSTALLLLQPDTGMALMVLLTFCFQLFASGMPIVLGLACCGLLLLTLLVAYFSFSHVALRLAQFFSSEAGYQVSKALASFRNGGLLGSGMGEGSVKDFLPDSHSDFIFATAGEELGGIACIGIMAAFLFIVARNMYIATTMRNTFKGLAIFGLAFTIWIHGAINIAVNLSIIPTKGIGLPFLSYGGSSTITSCMCIGAILALTRKGQTGAKYQIPRLYIPARPVNDQNRI